MPLMRFQVLQCVVAVMLLALVGCGGASQIWYPGDGGPQLLDTLVLEKQNPPLQKDEIRIQNIGKTETQSFHLVWIQNAEGLHTHADHDLTVQLVKGKGTITVGDKTVPIKVGDLVTIPRGTVHRFVNAGPEPAAGWAIFNPPFDGKDTVPVASPSPGS